MASVKQSVQTTCWNLKLGDRVREVRVHCGVSAVWLVDWSWPGQCMYEYLPLSFPIRKSDRKAGDCYRTQLVNLWCSAHEVLKEDSGPRQFTGSPWVHRTSCTRDEYDFSSGLLFLPLLQIRPFQGDYCDEKMIHDIRAQIN